MRHTLNKKARKMRMNQILEIFKIKLENFFCLLFFSLLYRSVRFTDACQAKRWTESGSIAN